MPEIPANYDENVATALTRPLVLIGMMGTGKSQLGRHLAKSMGLPFADTDNEFEAAAGTNITDYFAKYGEDAFRVGELKVLDRLLDGTPKVVSAGGGIITLPEARSILRDRAVCVWLTADPDVLAKRVAGNAKRPLLQGGDAAEILSALLEKRKSLYEEVAAFSVATDKAVGDEALRHVLEGLTIWSKK